MNSVPDFVRGRNVAADGAAKVGASGGALEAATGMLMRRQRQGAMGTGMVTLAPHLAVLRAILEGLQ